MGRGGQLVRPSRELVEVATAEPPPGGDQLGRDALRHEAAGYRACADGPKGSAPIRGEPIGTRLIDSTPAAITMS